MELAQDSDLDVEGRFCSASFQSAAAVVDAVRDDVVDAAVALVYLSHFRQSFCLINLGAYVEYHWYCSYVEEMFVLEYP